VPVLLGACLLGGCQPTAVVVGIVTDLHVPGELDAVAISVTADGNVELENTGNPWALSGPAAEHLPGTLTLQAGSGRPTLDIEVVGLHGASSILSRRVSMRMVEGEILFLRLALSRSCLGVDCGDPALMTCVDGRCEPTEVDGATLPPDQDGIDGRFECSGPDGATFIDTRTSQVLRVRRRPGRCAHERRVGHRCPRRRQRCPRWAGGEPGPRWWHGDGRPDQPTRCRGR
jgi:hypothetical protein